ncbi:hypothetical protein [Methanolobus sp. WCC4]|uniref:hypothetical protein n=1 Tax=Methanolobus sp. WCC4 TaxID=3125784 RepID=UPI0030F6E4CD
MSNFITGAEPIQYEGRILTDEEDKFVIEENTEQEMIFSPWRSAFYSLVFPGLGQMNNGEQGRGSYYFVITFILIISSYLVIPAIVLAIFWPYNIYQAYTYARKNQLKDRDEPEK